MSQTVNAEGPVYICPRCGRRWVGGAVPHFQQEGQCGGCRMDEMFSRTRGLKAKLDLEMEMHDALDNAIRGAIEMRAEIERLRAIETAAKALRNRLKAVHDDPAFKSVWVVNQLHSGPYRGMTYTAALADLDAALQGSANSA